MPNGLDDDDLDENYPLPSWFQKQRVKDEEEGQVVYRDAFTSGASSFGWVSGCILAAVAIPLLLAAFTMGGCLIVTSAARSQHQEPQGSATLKE